ncbi:MAG: DUF2946 family protein [Pseudomonadota bacterium]
MNSLRVLIRDHRHLALALLVLAFGIKAVIPAGFMVSASNDTVLTVTICSGSGSLETMQMVIPGKDGGHTDSPNMGEHCTFSGLTKVATGGADAILLALAFAFILSLGLALVQRLPIGRISYLRPPLRGPPTAA